MGFNELGFWYLCIPVILLYWVVPHQPRKYVMLFSSLFFYALFDYRLISLILISTIIDFTAGFFAAPPRNIIVRRIALISSIIGNLAVLFAFKYFYQHISDFGFSTMAYENHWGHWLLAFGFPVGISFFTFQTMSYTFDCYRGKFTPTRSLLQFSLFVCFFPQLIAGPIERPHELLPQMGAKKKWQDIQWQWAIYLLLLGFVKKNFFAAYLSNTIETMRLIENPTGPQLTLIGFLMIFLVYTDFSGYSDIGRGIAKLFAIDMYVNFWPFYFARNPSEFWMRWNLTFTTWIRDYVVFPLIRLYRNVIWSHIVTVLVMVLIGFWHGASLNWLLFGLWQGVVIEIYRLNKAKQFIVFKGLVGTLAARLLMVSSLIIMGLLHFAGDGSDFFFLVKQSTQHWNMWSDVLIILGSFLAVYFPLFVFEYFQEKKRDYDFLLKRSWLEKTIFVAVALVFLYYARNYEEQPFIYFRF